jgi:hypothetical protein
LPREGLIGSVSVRNDPMDAIEDVLFSEPIDELLLCVAGHGFPASLHQDPFTGWLTRCAP